MRLAFVVQRYGAAVNGGAELHCRLLAEHLVRCPEVTSVRVLTTCAVDYRTWRNATPSGVERAGEIVIERFASLHTRHELLQSALSTILFTPFVPDALRATLEERWIEAQGPVVPDLLERLSQIEPEVDLLVFFTYLYYPTVRGLPRVAHKAILVPTAHDEPPIRLRIFDVPFAAARGFAFNTPEERDFVDARFGLRGRPHALVGAGVDVPPEVLAQAGSDRPFILYLGRISKNKGLGELCEGFVRFQRQHASARLEGARGGFCGRELDLRIAGGGDWARITKRADIIREGFVDEARKHELLRNCELVIVPSRYESLSLALLEAWAFGRAALVEHSCAATLGQVQRSGGGGSYSGARELPSVLCAWLSSAERRQRAGLAGRRYVEQSYTWQAVGRRFLEFAEQVLA